MEMLDFAQAGAPRGDDLREAILDLAAGDKGIRGVLHGYTTGAAPAEDATSKVHAALREAGMSASLQATAEALEGIAAGLRGTGPPVPEPPEAVTNASTDREPSKILCRLYDHGVRLELRDDGQLYAGRDGGLTPEQRWLLREHSGALKRLLTDEAMGEVWSEAVRYVAKALGGDVEGEPCDRVTGFLDRAQDAYERYDNGLCRYLLRRAALAAKRGSNG